MKKKEIAEVKEEELKENEEFISRDDIDIQVSIDEGTNIVSVDFIGFDGTGGLNRPSEKKQFFRQRGLSRIRVGNDGKGSTLFNFLGQTHGASREDKGIVTHNTGIYLHAVPVHAPSGLCAIKYDEAEELNYFKIDFLNVGVYKDVKDEEHLVHLMNTEPL